MSMHADMGAALSFGFNEVMTLHSEDHYTCILSAKNAQACFSAVREKRMLLSTCNQMAIPCGPCPLLVIICIINLMVMSLCHLRPPCHS